jgi:hypothetical protein
VLSVSYVGTQNRHQNYYTETNLIPYNQSLLADYVNGVTGTPAYNSQVPYLGYHSIKQAVDEANADYNGLQTSFRGQTLSNDLSYQFGYTYSHTNDSFNSGGSAGDLYAISNPYAGWKYDFGPSAFDHRNVFFANFVYDLPFMKHSDNKFAKTFIGGWEVSGIVSAFSGAPINIGLAGTVGGVSNVANNIVPNSANRPNQSGTAHNPHTAAEWFDTSIYSVPTPGTWGDTPHNSVWGPGRDNWNVSLFKNFVLSETRGSSIQFRAEFFNIWNHTQFQADGINGGSNGNNGGISGNLGSSNFGAITSAYDPRTIQLALKAYF